MMVMGSFWTFGSGAAPAPPIGDELADVKRHHLIKHTMKWFVVFLPIGGLYGGL